MRTADSFDAVGHELDGLAAHLFPGHLDFGFHPDGTQGPTINQVVASIAASYIEKLLAGTCTWMASYIDMDDGIMRCLPADRLDALRQQRGNSLLWVSAAEIVVVQALDEHPVAWRLAGLDRDPGYLPSAGRKLRFVFD